jgi:hypothetical protein
VLRKSAHIPGVRVGSPPRVSRGASGSLCVGLRVRRIPPVGRSGVPRSCRAGTRRRLSIAARWRRRARGQDVAWRGPGMGPAPSPAGYGREVGDRRGPDSVCVGGSER